MKPVLVLLPGLLNDHRLWAHQVQGLADMAECRVADLTRDDTIQALAMRILDETPGQFALAGLSMGGYVAMEIMRRAPERVTRLALISTSARPDTPEQAQRRRDAVAVANAGGFEKIMPVMLPNLVHPDHLGLERVGGVVRQMALAVGPQAFARQQGALMRRPDSRPGLPRIECPTLVLVGRDDTLTPLDRAQEMADLIADATLTVVETCGHLSTLEQPQVVTGHMRDWLLR